MTLSKKKREILIQLRFEQADEAIEDVKILLEHNRFNASVNRIYYGTFYALSAHVIKYKFETAKHGQLIGWFNKEFVHEGLVDTTYGKMINQAFNRRLKSDYDPQVNFDKSTIEKMYQDMIAFIGKMKSLLNH